MSEPQAAQELQWCARHLLANPMTLEETDRDTFRLIRRHEEALDRWFTQRLGYRLHIAAGTARLYKTTVVAQRRQLLTAGSTRRPFGQREYVLLALVLAAVAAGPRVVSLRDLVERVRTAAADAAFGLSEDYGERRDLVNVVNWLVAQGVVRELHERVGSYVDDQEADALLEIDPDRVALLPLPALARAETAGELIDRSDRRAGARQWMRAFLAEEPVLYRSDLTDAEWGELRRRLGEEADMLGEMFGLALEIRAEGVAAVDPSGNLTDRQFPATRAVGHTALLLLERLTGPGRASLIPIEQAIGIVGELAGTYRKQLGAQAADPAKLARAAIELLADHRLVRRLGPSLDEANGDATEPDAGPGGHGHSHGHGYGPSGEQLEILPMAHRFAVDGVVVTSLTRDGGSDGDGPGGVGGDTSGQGSLW